MSNQCSFFDSVSHAGILPTDSEELRLRKSLLIFATGLISFASMLWLFIYWQLGPQFSSTIPFVFQLLLIGNLAVYLKTLDFKSFRLIQISLFLFMPFVAQWGMGNFITASGLSLWALLAPVGAVLFVGCAVGRISIWQAMRTIWPFYFAAFATLMLVTYIPALSLWLPSVFR